MAQRRIVLETEDTYRESGPEDLFGAALSNMDDKYLQCRDISHPWRIERDFHLVDADREADVQPRLGHSVFVRRTFKCPRCGKKRTDAYIMANNKGWQSLEKINTTYKDPPNFGIKGIGHMSGARDMVRGERFRRVITKTSAE